MILLKQADAEKDTDAKLALDMRLWELHVAEASMCRSSSKRRRDSTQRGNGCSPTKLRRGQQGDESSSVPRLDLNQDGDAPSPIEKNGESCETM